MARIFSGIQPSGNLHIGNYLGAIKNWVKLQDDFECIYCIVDMHAITVPQDPEKLRKNVLELAKVYLASGIDPKKSMIFIQSQVSEHAELAWILNTIAKISELEKMTQFKDKAGLKDRKGIDEYIIKSINEYRNANKKMWEIITSDHKNNYNNINFKEEFVKNNVNLETLHNAVEKLISIRLDYLKQEKIGVGLYDYPVLMAADILLYDTEKVPVGEDQVQHVELTRTLGRRFNQKFGETFVIPEPYLTKEGTRIMGLDDPTKKMSKSAGSEYNYIAITDDAETVRKKIKKAVTDSGSEIEYKEEKPALRNLINIYSVFSGKKTEEIVEMYKGKGYADFKSGLAEEVIGGLKPIQERMKSLSDDEVLNILRKGAEKVRPIAKAKLDEVKKKVGFIF